MRISKSAVLLVAALALVGTTGVATASTTAAPPKAVGACAKQSGGALRLLEAKNLAKSQHGKCSTGETRVLLPTTVAAGPKGEAGAVGPKGDVGPQGLKGETGPAGPKGEQGVKGETGAAGKDGTNGRNGRGFGGAPIKMTFVGNGPYACTWTAATSTLNCVTG